MSQLASRPAYPRVSHAPNQPVLMGVAQDVSIKQRKGEPKPAFSLDTSSASEVSPFTSGLIQPAGALLGQDFQRVDDGVGRLMPLRVP